MIINYLLINLIVTLVFLSGFWTSVDEAVYNRFKPYHLPHIFSCTLCQCFWLSILYTVIAGVPFLLGVVLSLINGHLTEITTPAITLIKNWLLRGIQAIMPK